MPALELRSWAILALGLGTILFVKATTARRKRNPRRLPLPPGPAGYPILGNATQIPIEKPWEGYNALCREHGDIVYLDALGQGMMMLGSRRRAVDLLEKRAAIYSDRPYLPFVELIGMFSWAFGVIPYGTRWREHRRAFHQQLNQNAVRRFHPLMQEERSLLLRRLQDTPENWTKHLLMFFGASIMRTAYGFDDTKHNESLVLGAEEIVGAFGEAAVPGKYLVNIFPSLSMVPAWFPGAGWKRHFMKVAELTRNVVSAPFQEAKEQLARGERSVHPSMAATFIDNLPEAETGNDESEHSAETVARDICAVAYVAGADTTVSSATGLVNALVNNPHVQLKAQAEIDAVIGAGRLPLISDRPQLPYIHAIVKEVSRWYTVIPIGVVHTNAEDDEYDGYFIPKGTYIFQNNWAIMHDPEVFEKPLDFVPERYLKDGKLNPAVLDPEAAAFGYGRRICPGRHFSNDALFLFAASVLATFTIHPKKDEHGNPIPAKFEIENHNVAKPLPFECEFVPRPGRGDLME
ncbi:cytochrome P450 98A3 [Ephemerocybe angulata]|uniref:Cytochrome P450 98A3 n=1 Tax=Ephemerocybe angulata TaxID=980116 RepID=A0A8H6HQ56_9AGAR|nr:cytochrome P450 98A3 [Tulosesus angulatus]